MNSEKRGVFGARKVRTPGFVDYSSSSGSTSSDDSTENAFSEKSLVESNKRTLLGGKSPENQAQQVSMTQSCAAQCWNPYHLSDVFVADTLKDIF